MRLHAATAFVVPLCSCDASSAGGQESAPTDELAFTIVGCDQPPVVTLPSACDGEDSGCLMDCAEMAPDAWSAWEQECGSEVAVCTTACGKVYGADQCAISLPGVSSDDLYEECLAGCKRCMAYPGEVGDYDPYATRGSSDDGPYVDNGAQAELWAQCVSEKSCEDLEDGYCEARVFQPPSDSSICVSE